jgi:pimeloyl-ACP methyl ester carboxylesterase
MMRPAIILVAAFIAILVAGTAIWLYTPDKPRPALEAKYATPPSQFLMVEGVRLHIRDTGMRNAPVIILLHGFGSSLHTWESCAQLLDTQYRVVRLDLPGFGLTGQDPTGDYTDVRSIAIVIALMDRLDIRRAVFVGNSMGGRIAWKFASLHPARVEKLVLIAPDGFASEGHAYGVAPEIPLTARLLPYALPQALVRWSLRPAYGDRSAMTDERVERYRDMLLAPGVRQAIVQRMAQNVLVDPEPLLRSIRAPTLLLWGEKDAMVPLTNAADYQRAIPEAKVVSFIGVGHLPQEEAPALTVEAIGSFLAQ